MATHRLPRKEWIGQKQWNAKNKPLLNKINRKAYYHNKYGLDCEEAAAKLRLNLCEICGVHKRLMVIDHLKGTRGTYRGILCGPCNTRLGWFEKRSKVILSYIENYEKVLLPIYRTTEPKRKVTLWEILCPICKGRGLHHPDHKIAIGFKDNSLVECRFCPGQWTAEYIKSLPTTNHTL